MKKYPSLFLEKSHLSINRVVNKLTKIYEVVICSFSAINASYMGKHGAINHLFKVISNINKKNAMMTKTALDTLVLLVKSSKYS